MDSFMSFYCVLINYCKGSLFSQRVIVVQLTNLIYSGRSL